MRNFRNYPFEIKWCDCNSNRNYINRFSSFKLALKRIEFLTIHNITDIKWTKIYDQRLQKSTHHQSRNES